MSDHAAALIEAHGLVFGYPGREAPALDGVSLRVPRGTRLALLGPNGAGKTTVLMHLNGALRPRAGEVCLDGVPQGYDRAALRAWRQRVQLVLQDPDDQLFAASVAEDVAFGPHNQGLAAAEIERRVAGALTDLDLEPLAALPPHLLSHGQRKRVALAGALAMAPEVLILDEPTAGLDHQGERRLLETLARLHARGTTLVLSTHDVDLAHAWADQVALFAAGRVIACGPPADILGDFNLLGAAGLAAPAVVRVARALEEAGIPLGNPRGRDLDALVARIRASCGSMAGRKDGPDAAAFGKPRGTGGAAFF
ncbi:energy-coupling factor ABC transporter ATP-binding protein [Pararhodospirillum oryzae]|uniref:ABC transporter ATP-binding protein n=1 Tax=Pararhodospirillum oryzae TaxID=478448 RepID=A0A512H735_9PROT|nr:ABC transporter ATP-binding protein [Pararhodospirillum oryzae]GEO81257.1 energy-coupling factor ABC transporter ATP-binding protein [Pararhodospirillum oryzae]